MGGSNCHLRKFSFVEPIVFVYFHWILLSFPLMGQYFYHRISEEEGFPYQNVTSDGSGCSEEHFGPNSTLKELEIKVQTKAAHIYTYYLIVSSVPSIIVSIFMASYSDKKGRKVALVLSLTGAFLETTLLLVVIHMKLNIYITLAGGIINGCSGYFITLWMALMAYLSDTVEKDKLSLRIAILQLFLFLAGTVSQLTSGLWIEYLGFKAPIWFLWASLLLIILYTIFFIKETVKPKKDVKAVFFSTESIKQILGVFTKLRPGARGRKNFILVILLISLNVMATISTASVQLLFLLRSPLCWIPSVLGYFLAYRFFTLGIAGVAGLAILKKCFSEMNITRIAFLSQMAAFLLLAFSDKTWMVFLVPVVGILGSVIEPVFSSILSRLASSQEQGVIFTTFGIISTLGDVMANAVFNSLYPLSLGFNFPGFVFVLSAGISFGLLFMTKCIDIPPSILVQGEETNEENIPENELLSEQRVQCLEDQEEIANTL